jgi:hypothetical protein
MRILVTGMLAGMDDAQVLNKLDRLAEINGKQIKIFNALDSFTSNGKKPFDRMLETTDYLFEVTREREYMTIAAEIEEKGYEHVIVRAPATVEWNRVNRKFKDQEVIKKYIKPDLIITLIEAEWSIKKRLDNPEKADPFLYTLKERHHNFCEILSWMNEEVSLSEDWAETMDIPHYVFATAEAAENLYKFLYYPKPWVVYASYSMTHATDEIRAQVNEVIERLKSYSAVIDPQAIEIAKDLKDIPPQDREAMTAFTVHRDLHWCVGKVDAIVAIHPYPERPPLSPGMMDELGHARDYHKARYMIFPSNGRMHSPFTTDSYIEKGHLFDTADEFFKYLEEKEGRKPFETSLTLTQKQ